MFIMETEYVFISLVTKVYFLRLLDQHKLGGER